MKDSSTSNKSNSTQIFNDIRDYRHWASRALGSTFGQKRKLNLQVDLFTKMSIHPTLSICLVVKIIPQSSMNTTIAYELYTQTAQNQANLESSIEKLKETTSAEIKQLEVLQKELIQERLVLDHGI